MANTSPLPIIAQPPYRRDTPIRHRRRQTGWIVERAARYAHAWLQQPVRVSRAQHAVTAALYGGIAIVIALIVITAVR